MREVIQLQIRVYRRRQEWHQQFEKWRLNTAMKKAFRNGLIAYLGCFIVFALTVSGRSWVSGLMVIGWQAISPWYGPLLYSTLISSAVVLVSAHRCHRFIQGSLTNDPAFFAMWKPDNHDEMRNSYVAFKGDDLQNSEDDENVAMAAAARDSEREWFLSTIGIAESASMEEIKSAYRRTLKLVHPDHVADMGLEVSQVATDMTKRLNSAYQKVINGIA